MSVDCTVFREHAEDLALGFSGVGQRQALLAHAERCAACQEHLDGLVRASERVLVTVTGIEPPEGFEQRVLERLGAAPPPAAVAATGSRPWRRRTVAFAAAAVLSLLTIGSLVLALRDDRGDPAAAVPSTTASTATGQAARQGAIVRPDGSVSGEVRLVRTPMPHVLVVVHDRPPGYDEVSCELVGSDGSTTVVGAWGYDDVANGVWAVGIDPSLLDSVRMNVRDAAGTVIASAELR